MSDNAVFGSYSFADVQAAITAPNGGFSLSDNVTSLADGGIADEGITIAMRDPVNTMVTGADGSVMHGLRVSKAGTITIRALKTGTINARLMDLYNGQTTSSAFHGRNVISVSNPVAGDSHTAVACAFQKLPDNVNALEGGMMEWVFDCGKITQKLGTGLSF